MKIYVAATRNGTGSEEAIHLFYHNRLFSFRYTQLESKQQQMQWVLKQRGKNNGSKKSDRKNTFIDKRSTT